MMVKPTQIINQRLFQINSKLFIFSIQIRLVASILLVSSFISTPRVLANQSQLALYLANHFLLKKSASFLNISSTRWSSMYSGQSCCTSTQSTPIYRMSIGRWPRYRHGLPGRSRFQPLPRPMRLHRRPYHRLLNTTMPIRLYLRRLARLRLSLHMFAWFQRITL